MSLLVETAAVLVVAFGALEAFVKILWIVATPSVAHGERKAVWRQFGVWLLVGLEFELPADISSSVVSPTWKDLGELGAIAVIRTFLNYFFEKDLSMPSAARRSVSQLRTSPVPKSEPNVAGRRHRLRDCPRAS